MSIEKLYLKAMRFSERNKQYFQMSQQQIADENSILLCFCSRAYCIFLLFYSILTYVLMPNLILVICYAVFGASGVGFLLFSRYFCRKRTVSFPVIQKVCLLFVWTVLAFTISISVFPFPGQPAIFFPLGFMLVSVLFILPFFKMARTLTLAFFIFAILVLLYKMPESASYDLFGGITTLLLGYFFLYVISDLRLRGGEALIRQKVLNRTDALTGLPNRRWASENMPPCYRRCQKMQLPVAAMMVDIDDFKKYNDMLGHPAGDACLKAIGEIILSYSSDLGILSARYGGEEFLFLLGDCCREEALNAAKGLLECVRIRAIPGPDGPVTISIGVAVQLPDSDSSMEHLIEEADAALYHSKRIGKNQFTLLEAD